MTILASPYQSDEVEVIERLHLPVGENDVRHPLLHIHEGVRRVVAKTDVLDAHGNQDRLDDRMHVPIVIDNQNVQDL